MAPKFKPETIIFKKKRARNENLCFTHNRTHILRAQIEMIRYEKTGEKYTPIITYNRRNSHTHENFHLLDWQMSGTNEHYPMIHDHHR